jgi:hypothetical protein
MTPLTDKYFIINEQKHYYIMLKEDGIQITNLSFHFQNHYIQKLTL